MLRVVMAMPKVGHLGIAASNRWIGKLEQMPPSAKRHRRTLLAFRFGSESIVPSGTAENSTGKLRLRRAAMTMGRSATGSSSIERVRRDRGGSSGPAGLYRFECLIRWLITDSGKNGLRSLALKKSRLVASSRGRPYGRPRVRFVVIIRRSIDLGFWVRVAAGAVARIGPPGASHRSLKVNG